MQIADRQSTGTLETSSIVLAFPNFRSGETSPPTDVHLTSLRSDRNSTPGRPSRCGGGRHPRDRPPPPGTCPGAAAHRAAPAVVELHGYLISPLRAVWSPESWARPNTMSRIGASPGEGERRMRQATRRRRRRSLVALGLALAAVALTGA